ncbi:SWIM zinc finger family protein [Paenibacillus sp. OAS669]|uniref:SWIM zinc finger family protein n=1 Tax=Paenibacillus sp. OAS669 TaxID=2663821 RepID=UPI00178A652C|nr:SWIM zinc finger family protein [Paenibacillus sp. OAS669]MBE1444905.1 hypothetical protein [Paenibacillus sp. OAS669]
MSLFTALNDEQWLLLLEQVAKSFNEVTLSRGFTYFKQQRIVRMIASEDRVIQAWVSGSGSEEYKVTLHLNHFSSNSCTCPVQDTCKHQAAVMMELADRLGYPVSQLVNAKHHIKRIKATPSPEMLLANLPGMKISGWHEMMNQLTSHVTPSYDLGMYSDMLSNQLQSIRMDSVPFSDTDRMYFELHLELFILRKMKEQTAKNNVNYYTSFALYRHSDKILAWLQEHSALVDFTLNPDRIKETLAYLRQQMLEDNHQHEPEFRIYTRLWECGADRSPEAEVWASEELNSLEEQPAHSSALYLLAVKAYLLLQRSQTKEAWKTLEEIQTIKKAPSSLFFPFLYHLLKARELDALVEWLIQTAPYFYGLQSKEQDLYISIWKTAISHVPQAEKHLWPVLEEMLPHSISIMEDLLYEQGKWKPWLELQLIQGHDPHYHRVSVLQPIEKEEPELLLPYYHQAIEQYVAQKNRHDYKLAVKLLKRLEKVYKKMKQVDRWDRFFGGFLERHSRLRALQEEMKKGKLLE